VCLIGIRLRGIYFMGMRLMGVYLMGVYLILPNRYIDIGDAATDSVGQSQLNDGIGRTIRRSYFLCL